MKIKVRNGGTPGTQSVRCPVVGRSRARGECGLGSRVVRTKRLPTGAVLRTRTCPRGHTFTTEEKPA